MSQPIPTAKPAIPTPAASSPTFAAVLRAALALPATATDAEVLAVLDALIARAAEPPTGYVAREAHEAACRELARINTALAAMEAEHRRARTGRIVADAVADPLLPADVRHAGLALALNSVDKGADLATGTATGLALNAEAATAAPEWVHLLPAGPLLAGRDGRQFTIADPAAIVAATVARGLPLVVDFDHASEIGERGTGSAPAAGWIEALEVRDGQVWGRVAWTARASTAIAAREFRFLSPVFNHTRDAAQTVVELVSAGLVHRPNLHLKALNAQQGQSFLKALCKILELADTASEAEALLAAQEVKDATGRAANAAEVPLDRYVGRETHDETVRALNAVTAQLAARDVADAKTRAERMVDDAVKAGKVTPAMRGHFMTMALNNFDTAAALVGSMPVLITGGESGAAQAADRGLYLPLATSLDDQQRAICANLGLDEADYASSLAAEAKVRAKALPRSRA